MKRYYIPFENTEKLRSILSNLKLTYRIAWCNTEIQVFADTVSDSLQLEKQIKKLLIS